MIWGYWNILDPENRTRKTDKFTKILNYSKSSCKFLCAKMFGYSHFILLTRRIKTFWFNSIEKVWSGGIEPFCVQKIIEEKSAKFKKIFELYQVFMCPKMFRYLQIIYCRLTLKAFWALLLTFPTTFPQLC